MKDEAAAGPASLPWAIGALAAQEEMVAALVAGVSAEDARFRPGPGQWSTVEVLAHLLDEEREDFRRRLDLTLHHPDTEWPPIDPEGWATARNYQERDLAETLAAWRAERQASLAWLRGIGTPDLAVARRHPAGFELRAGDLLAAWVAHDTLHLRQLVELRYALTARHGAPYSLRYAGDW
jgi:hypothetical protein